MRKLVVIYDAAELAVHARNWIEREAKYVPVELVAARLVGSSVTVPGLDAASLAGRITAVDDEGNVWRDGSAELVVLWALRRYRRRALEIRHPSRLAFRRSNLNWIAGGSGEPWPERRASG